MKPVLIPVEEVLVALGWHIECCYPDYARLPHRQVWTARGVVLIPLPGAAPAAPRPNGHSAADDAA